MSTSIHEITSGARPHDFRIKYNVCHCTIKFSRASPDLAHRCTQAANKDTIHAPQHQS